jgi:hypothetical protein
MPTRAERAAEAEAKFRTRKEALTREIARQQAVQRNEDRKARDKRRYLVGKMLDEAGLFAWSDASVERVVELLAPLGPLANPDLIIGRVLARIPLAKLIQETAEVNAEVEALIAGNVTLLLVDDEGHPLEAAHADPVAQIEAANRRVQTEWVALQAKDRQDGAVVMARPVPAP